MDNENSVLIEVLKRGIWCAEERIDRAQREIWRLKLQLAQLGVELPCADSAPNPVAAAADLAQVRALAADSSRHSPAAADPAPRTPLDELRATPGRCAVCGHTEEAHSYRGAPKCSLCGCQGYVEGGQA